MYLSVMPFSSSLPYCVSIYFQAENVIRVTFLEGEQCSADIGGAKSCQNQNQTNRAGKLEKANSRTKMVRGTSKS